jgi:hypothetical protein
METLTSREGADLLRVNVQKFHRLVADYQVEPLIVGPGLRGAKFWRPDDIARIARAIFSEDGNAA